MTLESLRPKVATEATSRLVTNNQSNSPLQAGDKRKTPHQHLFLPKDYSRSPRVSLYTPWTEAEVYDHLTTGWGQDTISDLKLGYLYGPAAEVS